MINSNDMYALSLIGLGSDIDMLETYVVECRLCELIGVECGDQGEYEVALNLLKELKPGSMVFTANWVEEVGEESQFDGILKKHPMEPVKRINSMGELDWFIDELSGINALNKQDNSVNLYAAESIDGIRFRAVYSNGYLVEGSLQSTCEKGKDITELVKGKLPCHIKEWGRVGLVEVRGVITVNINEFEKIDNIFKEPVGAVIDLVNGEISKSTLGKIQLIADEVIGDSESAEVLFGKDLSGRMDYLDELGFFTPERAVLQDVNYYNVEESIQKIIDNFSNIDEEEQQYFQHGIIIAIDNIEMMKQCNNAMFEMVGGSAFGSNHIYESKILGISWKNDGEVLRPVLDIETTVLLNGGLAKSVEVGGADIIEEYDLLPGNMVRFRYRRDGRAMLCDEQGVCIIR